MTAKLPSHSTGTRTGHGHGQDTDREWTGLGEGTGRAWTGHGQSMEEHGQGTDRTRERGEGNVGHDIGHQVTAGVGVLGSMRDIVGM